MGRWRQWMEDRLNRRPKLQRWQRLVVEDDNGYDFQPEDALLENELGSEKTTRTQPVRRYARIASAVKYLILKVIAVGNSVLLFLILIGRIHISTVDPVALPPASQSDCSFRKDITRADAFDSEK